MKKKQKTKRNTTRVVRLVGEPETEISTVAQYKKCQADVHSPTAPP